ncbi:MAG: PilN domain-containing protein [Pasteurella sp.]|nr:PilN domain-containing protein [Pasteurella sp.]
MAIQFNLLPWREEKRQEHIRKTRNILLLGVFLGLVSGALFYTWKQTVLSDHRDALRYITEKNNGLKPLLKEKKKLDKMKEVLTHQVDAIEALQANRASVSHMVEELSVANNQQLFLTDFSLTDGQVRISGIAKNDSQISDLMKRLRESKWYQEPRLLEIISVPEKGEEIKRFSVVSQLLLPGSELNKEDGDG